MNIVDKIKHVAHKVAHGFAHLEHPFHITYLGLVFVEGHGLYALVAGPAALAVLFVYIGELMGGE